MKKRYLYPSLLAALFLGIGFAGGLYTGMKRGIPFVAEREQWTIGIYEGTSPLSFAPRGSGRTPVLRAEDVTDISAKFVADPFMVAESPEWYLFFEVYNNATRQGDLAVATSSDGKRWHYQRVVLDEPFHLSYPYVFEWQDEYYLIPESFEANSIRLYKATEFPYRWTFVDTLVSGKDYVDNSIVYFNDRWWLFSATTQNDTLYLHYADDLLGPWHEYPESPIVSGNKHYARPSGRLLVDNDRLYRYTMDVDPPAGTHQVWAFEITELTPEHYVEELASAEPILKPDGSGWNAQAMHQIDAHQVGEDKWMAVVDGFGTYLVFGLRY